MKNYLTILLVLIKLSVLSQIVDYENFDSELMNKVMLEKFNEFRRSRSLDTLVYSEVLYQNISKRNCLISSTKDSLYHPSAAKLWSGGELVNKVGRESNRKIGGKVHKRSGNVADMCLVENAYRTKRKLDTYQQIAWDAIWAWELSPAHREAQNKIYQSKGLPGMYSCHSEYSNKGYVYIFINFVEVRRD